VRQLILLFSLFFLGACSQNPVEKRQQAIDIALSLLSRSECIEAIKILEDAGRDFNNAVYVSVLSSAYACRANFDAVDFIATDIGSINTNAANLFNSLSILTLSPETQTDSTAYMGLKAAIEIITNSATAASGQAGRTSKFGTRKAGDLGVQLILYSVVQLGKFLNYFGNVNALGNKGFGTQGTNQCFLTYSTFDAIAAASAGGGVCDPPGDAGHPDLSLASISGRRRACEGLVLFTNILDTLNNIDLSGNTSLRVLEDAATSVSQFRDSALAVNPNLGTLLAMTSQDGCENLLSSSSTERNNIELIYALIFESGLQ
jgi:hypothetical protein